MPRAHNARVFDIEVQVADTKELSERARYYQSIMDVDMLKSGEPYRMLKEAHVIFLCMSDVFARRLPVYTFENLCREDSRIALGDRSYKHFFIAPTCATMLTDGDRKAFFELLTANKSASPLTDRLKAYVDDAKHNTQWRVQYMNWERQRTYDFEDGVARGRAEGERSAKLAAAQRMLANKMPASDVVLYTGLPLADVQRLATASYTAR